MTSSRGRLPHTSANPPVLDQGATSEVTKTMLMGCSVFSYTGGGRGATPVPFSGASIFSASAFASRALAFATLSYSEKPTRTSPSPR